MPSHLTPGVYEPEALKIMGDAFDRAWKEFRPRTRNAELVRNLMACAIIEAVDAGAMESTILVDKALHAVRAAISEDREAPRPVAMAQIANRMLGYPLPRRTDIVAFDFAQCLRF
ncbi:MAG: hypothetical protein E7774_15330 [Bradyrhizobium sp.]|nr:MAG: hypothetical protein E7774_15330 [Bradyrhizobium sp.]